MDQDLFQEFGLSPNSTRGQIAEAHMKKITEVDRSYARASAEKHRITEVYQKMLKLKSQNSFEIIGDINDDLMSEDGSDFSDLIALPVESKDSNTTKLEITQHKSSEIDLPLSFEEIFRGGNKRLTVKINEPDGSSSTEKVCIKIPPGAPPGHPIPLPMLCNPIGIPKGLSLVVCDKPNQRFTRSGTLDVEYTAKITAEQSEHGCEMLIPTLENDPITLTYDDEEITKDTVEVFSERGLPKMGEKRTRGNLVVRFKIVDKVNAEEQQQQIYQQFDKEPTIIEVYRSDLDQGEEVEFEQKPEKQTEVSKRKLEPIKVTLVVTLKDLLLGHKQYTIDRKVLDGDGTETIEKHNVTFDLKPGIKSDSKVTATEEGHRGVEFISGDVIATVIIIEKHHLFKRHGSYDIIYFTKVSEAQLDSGEIIKIPTLEEDFLDLEIDEKTLAKKEVRFWGRGLPKEGEIRGDLLVQFEVQQDSDGFEEIDENQVKSEEQQPEKMNCSEPDSTSKYDIKYTAKITPSEAILGGVVRVPCVNGSIVEHQFTGGKTLDSFEIVPEKGLPVPGTNGKRGNLIITYDILLGLDQMAQDPPIQKDISITLEQILRGCTKKVKISKVVRSVDGSEMIESKVIAVNIEPGTEAGFQYIFPREGDVHLTALPADIILTIKEKPHELFARKGADIIYEREITRSELSSGKRIPIPNLEKTNELTLALDSILDRKGSRRFANHGLPNLKDHSKKRGDLIVNYKVVEDPQDDPVYHDLHLTLEQLLHGYTKKQLKIKRRTFDRHGKEVNTTDKVITIQVPPSTALGTLFTFPKLGDKYPNRTPSDLIFVAKDKPHHKFTRDGFNILYSVNLTHFEASKGISLDIPTLDGEYLKLDFKKKEVKRFCGYGLPLPDNPNKRGDLLVEFAVLDNKLKNKSTTQILNLTLEDILTGCTKETIINRTKIFDSDGNAFHEQKTLSVQVQPGVRDGFQIIFPHEGDQKLDRVAGDIVFAVKQLEHEQFKRFDNDLKCELEVTKEKAIRGGGIKVPLLGGGTIILPFDKVITNKTTRTLYGLGLPKTKDPSKRGDLIVKFKIVEDRSNSPVAKSSSTKDISEMNQIITEKMVQNAEVQLENADESMDVDES